MVVLPVEFGGIVVRLFDVIDSGLKVCTANAANGANAAPSSCTGGNGRIAVIGPGDAVGGAVYALNSSVLIDSGSFSGNTALGGNSVTTNFAGGSAAGGALALEGTSRVTSLAGATFTGNNAVGGTFAGTVNGLTNGHTDGGNGVGGAISVNTGAFVSNLTLLNDTFKNNTASGGDAGHVTGGNAYGGAIYGSAVSNVILRSSTLARNAATGGYAGDGAVGGGAGPSSRNSGGNGGNGGSAYGGAVDAANAVTAQNVTIVYNQAVGGSNGKSGRGGQSINQSGYTYEYSLAAIAMSGGISTGVGLSATGTALGVVALGTSLATYVAIQGTLHSAYLLGAGAVEIGAITGTLIGGAVVAAPLVIAAAVPVIVVGAIAVAATVDANQTLVAGGSLGDAGGSFARKMSILVDNGRSDAYGANAYNLWAESKEHNDGNEGARGTEGNDGRGYGGGFYAGTDAGQQHRHRQCRLKRSPPGRRFGRGHRAGEQHDRRLRRHRHARHHCQPLFARSYAGEIR